MIGRFAPSLSRVWLRNRSNLTRVTIQRGTRARDQGAALNLVEGDGFESGGLETRDETRQPHVAIDNTPASCW